MKAYTLPSPAEQERLQILAEECAEVIQVIQKIQRFGFDDTKPGQKLTNRERLEEELGHVMNMKSFMIQHRDIDPEAIENSEHTKGANIYRWLTRQ